MEAGESPAPAPAAPAKLRTLYGDNDDELDDGAEAVAIDAGLVGGGGAPTGYR